MNPNPSDRIRSSALTGLIWTILLGSIAFFCVLGACSCAKADPIKNAYASQAEALRAASSAARLFGGTLVLTSGTPSMRPLIVGRVYAVAVRNFASVKARDLLVYVGRPNANLPETTTILHRAVEHDRYGWLMSGDNNRWTESWDRVTADNYRGTVLALYAFPQ